MSLLVFPKGSDGQISKHFRSREFDCPCDRCSHTFVDSDFLRSLDALRDELGCEIKITSGYRCDYKQEQLREAGYETAKGVSTHTQGIAADLMTGTHAGIVLEAAARKVGITSVGVGSNWVHVDKRLGERRWEYRT